MAISFANCPGFRIAKTLPDGPPLTNVLALASYETVAAFAFENPNIDPIPPKALSTQIVGSTDTFALT